MRCRTTVLGLLLPFFAIVLLAGTDVPGLVVHRIRPNSGVVPAAAAGLAPRDSRPSSAAPLARLNSGAIASSIREALLTHSPVAMSFAVVAEKPLSRGRTRDLLTLRRAGTGTPLQLPGENGGGSFVAESLAGAGSDDVAIARDFLRRHSGELHLADADRELVVERQERDTIGRRHIRFAQQYRGTPVWPAELTVHLDRSGRVELVDGNFIATPRRIAPAPLVDAATAVRLACRAVGANGGASAPELIVYAPHDRYPRLAWRIDTSASLLSRCWVVVDASTGVILDRISRVMSDATTGSGADMLGITRQLKLWQSGGSYYLINTTKQMYDPTSQPPDLNQTRGAIVTLDANNQPATANPDSLPDLYFPTSSSPNSWSVPASVSAAYWISATYDYYLRQFGRNSIDGKGGTIKGVTRLGAGMLNAFWLDGPGLMIFGDGDTFAAGIDVIGHEMTHGVTSNTAALIYKDQAGALNEAMSDVFGEMIEADATGSNDWLLGTHLAIPQLHRSMINPGQYNQPAKMSNFVHTSDDNGGVHINSGIINHAFYLLAEGLSGGIGRRDASAIFYRALTQHLVKDSQFIDARLACVASANELFGAGSTQASMTAQAFDAVEIFDASAPPEAPHIPTVNGSDSTLFIYFDTATKAYVLARKETAGDGALGIPLSRYSVAEERPSVTGDGSMAVFVDSTNDVCLIATDNSEAETCVGLPAQGVRVNSVGMSRDARRFGFVLLRADGTPDNRIVVVDLKTNATQPYDLKSGSFDGGNMATILFADAMSFTSDGQFIVFDAWNALSIAGGSKIGAWSIAALDLDSGTAFDVVSPQAGLDIEFPDIGRTTDDLLAFEVRNGATGQTSVVAADLATSKLNVIGTTAGVLSVPSYTGNDRAIVYGVAASTPTKTSLYIQPLAADGITPAGAASLWLADAEFATIYRRGEFAGPTMKPGQLWFSSQSYKAKAGATATITVDRVSGNQGAISVAYRTQDGTAVAGRDYSATSGVLSWADGDDASKTFRLTVAPSAAASSLSIVLSNATGGAQLGTDRATVTIAPSASQTPTRRRSARH